jgi:epoxyqueuosine reductase QueG
MKQQDFKKLIPECCRIGFASVDQYDNDEKAKIETFLPDVKTVIVVAHHIRHSLEWIWFSFLADGSDETCPADLHTKLTMEKICNKLDRKGYEGLILPYPGQCGVMFKTLAVKTGLGQLGDNYLFMSHDWGPWIHLRVALTNARIDFNRIESHESCNHCGSCVDACLSGAIMKNDFDGLKCRDNMRAIRNSLGNLPNIYECEVCLRACPVGEKPKEVTVSYVQK